MFKFLFSCFLAVFVMSAAHAATVIFDDGNFGGSFDGDSLGTLSEGLNLVRGSNDGTCLSTSFGGIECDTSVPTDNLQSSFNFELAAGTELRAVTITAGGFGPTGLSSVFLLDLPPVPIFDAAGSQITSDLPVFSDTLAIGESAALLEPAKALFLFPASQPEIPFAGPAEFSFLVFSGNSEGLGRFGVQWQVELEVGLTSVPLPTGMALLLTGIGMLGLGRRVQKAA